MRLSLRICLAVLVASSLSLGLVGFVSAAPRPAFTSQQTSTIEGLGDYTSAALDGMGRTHVAYFDPSRDALVYAFQTQSGWRTELVDGDGMVGDTDHRRGHGNRMMKQDDDGPGKKDDGAQ